MASPPDDQLAALGRVIVLASLLEWDLMMLSEAACSISDGEALELLKSRVKLIRAAKESLKLFSEKLKLPDFLEHKEFFKRVDDAFLDRDQVAHGIYLFDESGHGVFYHPRSKEAIDLNLAHLQTLAMTLDNLSAETVPMTKIINDRKKELNS